MIPTPLTDPEGRVWAYLCGACGRAHASPERLQTRSARRGPDAKDLEYAKASAERCCTCHNCGKSIRSYKERSLLRCKACDEGLTRAHRLYRARRRVSERAFNAEHERRIGLAKNRDAAFRLVGRMRELSEQMFCAGWDSSLEFSLWRDVLEKGFEPKTMMQALCGRASKAEAAQLRGLACRAGGWWMWWTEPKGCKGEHACGEVFVPMKEWKRIYAEYCKKQETGTESK